MNYLHSKNCPVSSPQFTTNYSNHDNDACECHKFHRDNLNHKLLDIASHFDNVDRVSFGGDNFTLWFNLRTPTGQQWELLVGRAARIGLCYVSSNQHSICFKSC